MADDDEVQHVDKEDFGSTTAVLRRRAPGFAWLPAFLRTKLTPALAGAAIWTVFLWVAYFFNSPQKDIAALDKRLTESNARIEAALGEAVKVLNATKVDQEGLKRQVADLDRAFTNETNRQLDWREELARKWGGPPYVRPKR